MAPERRRQRWRTAHGPFQPPGMIGQTRLSARSDAALLPIPQDRHDARGRLHDGLLHVPAAVDDDEIADDWEGNTRNVTGRLAGAIGLDLVGAENPARI